MGRSWWLPSFASECACSCGRRERRFGDAGSCRTRRSLSGASAQAAGAHLGSFLVTFLIRKGFDRALDVLVGVLRPCADLVQPLGNPGTYCVLQRLQIAQVP